MESVIIPFLCAQLSIFAGPQYGPACSSAVTAASIQSGVHKTLEDTQNKVQRIVLDQTGEKIWQVGMAGYTLVGSQKLQFSTSIRPIADSLSLTATTQTQSLSLSWAF